jgi:5-oxopent-3-ene-1,2,5-tricarboxylate decarboxylase/2-hydroxyhepta-2,4-diene-1,7-dioate isomerase
VHRSLSLPAGLSGRVYGVLLNHRSAVDHLGETVLEAPYKGAPRAPVLFIKPRNTLVGHGDDVVVPSEVSELEIAGSVGIVIGRTACKVNAREALDYVCGCIVVNDLCIPHAVYYRPSIRYRARDGFCPLGAEVIPRAAVRSPDNLTVRTLVDGRERGSYSTADLVRSSERLLEDVTEFMTLGAGDILMLGAAAPAPRAKPGQTVAIEVEGLGGLENRLVRAAGVAT